MDNNNYFTDISFADKVRRRKHCVMYELVPPSKDIDERGLKDSVSLIVSLLKKLSVDVINIPEVREEKRNGEREAEVIVKFEPHVLAGYLFSAGFRGVIVNRPIVYIPWDEQRKWLNDIYKDKSIRNFIFVGGESSKEHYPGFSVTQAARDVTQTKRLEFADIFLGGISIPTRKNEAERLIEKTLAGIEFFTTQILYESNSIKKLLQEYWDLCVASRQKAKMIFLSFAPVTCKKDIDLLSWLGVKIPQETLQRLVTGWLSMGWRSLGVCKEIIEDVFEFVKKRDIQVPLGINVGYINRHNFEFSITFLEQLSSSYRKNINL
jgi:5,10-methylenetetrahydrofolate reductase